MELNLNILQFGKIRIKKERRSSQRILPSQLMRDMSFGALTHSILRRFVSHSGAFHTGNNDAAPAAPYQPNTSRFTARLSDVVSRTFDLGFTAFGGPPVHFQIFHRRFVDGQGKTPWIDEQTAS
jgi:hypothetical protein